MEHCKVMGCRDSFAGFKRLYEEGGELERNQPQQIPFKE